MDQYNIQERLASVEGRLKAIDASLETYLQSIQETQEHVSRQLQVALVKDMRDIINNGTLLQVGLHVETLKVSMERRLASLEKKIEESSGNSIGDGVISVSEHEREIKKFATELDKVRAERNRFQALYQNTPLSPATSSGTQQAEPESKAKEELEEAQKQGEEEQKAREVEKKAQEAKEKAEEEKRKADEAAIEKLQEEFKEEQRRKGSIRVVVRIRPHGKDVPAEDLVNWGPEIKSNVGPYWGKMHIPKRVPSYDGGRTEYIDYNFNRVFGVDASNNDVFGEITDLVHSTVFGGDNGIFTYGQTGAGKSYTLSHKDPENPEGDGLIPRALRFAFDAASKGETGVDYHIKISAVEVYLGFVYDLLQPIVNKRKTQTKDTPTKRPTVKKLSSLQEAEEQIDEITSRREIAATGMNATSSRSHLVLTLRVKRTRHGLKKGDKDWLLSRGRLYIADLAGSERPGRSGSVGKELQEGNDINQQLGELRAALEALAEGRNALCTSNLTKALQPVLTKGCTTMMFLMVSPFQTDLNVSFQTLGQGAKASKSALALIEAPATTSRPSSSHGVPETSRPKSSRGGKAGTLRLAPGSRSNSKPASPALTPTSSRGGRGGAPSSTQGSRSNSKATPRDATK
ncbi:hypothetical protein M426DRAFT_9733 [Hypoxylon sp. CI-4A]|nr:hypothetical protein M426DRAFT_9733 [Hypoxylon sp. CI-4A]